MSALKKANKLLSSGDNFSALNEYRGLIINNLARKRDVQFNIKICNKRINRNRQGLVSRVAIFASYDGGGMVHDYVLYYLEKLHEVADLIIFVCDNVLSANEQSKIHKHC